MSHPNTMPPRRLLKDQFGRYRDMTCISTYPVKDARACAGDKRLLLLRGRSVHVMKSGNDLHLYRATADLKTGGER